MNIIGYLRVSTDQQAESGLGLDAQKAAIAEYVKKMNADSHELFSDEGLSGALALDKRPGMLDAIGALTKGAVLVVAKRDRLGRDPMVLAMIESAVKRKGARIVSVAGEGTGSDEPSEILMRRMIDAFSEYERLIIGARTRGALRAKREKGQRVGHIPFGKKLADDGIHLILNEPEATILRAMHKLRSHKKSIRCIAQELNNQGILNRGSAWNHASVHRILKV
jgi:DNA invertase Pin-like site-specific DNA recombinase